MKRQVVFVLSVVETKHENMKQPIEFATNKNNNNNNNNNNNIGDASLLEAQLFIGRPTVLDNAWLARCDNLARAADRLRMINAHYALILLKVICNGFSQN